MSSPTSYTRSFERERIAGALQDTDDARRSLDQPRRGALPPPRAGQPGQQAEQVRAVSTDVQALSGRVDSFATTVAMHEERLMNQARLLSLTQEAIEQQTARARKGHADLEARLAALESRVSDADPRAAGLLGLAERLGGRADELAAMPTQLSLLHERLGSVEERLCDTQGRVTELAADAPRLLRHADLGEIVGGATDRLATGLCTLEAKQTRFERDTAAALTALAGEFKQRLDGGLERAARRRAREAEDAAAALFDERAAGLRRELLASPDLHLIVGNLVVAELTRTLADRRDVLVGEASGAHSAGDSDSSDSASDSGPGRGNPGEEEGGAPGSPGADGFLGLADALCDVVSTRLYKAVCTRLADEFSQRLEYTVSVVLREVSGKLADTRSAIKNEAAGLACAAVSAQTKAEEALGAADRSVAACRHVLTEARTLSLLVDEMLNNRRGRSAAARARRGARGLPAASRLEADDVPVFSSALLAAERALEGVRPDTEGAHARAHTSARGQAGAEAESLEQRVRRTLRSAGGGPQLSQAPQASAAAPVQYVPVAVPVKSRASSTHSQAGQADQAARAGGGAQDVCMDDLLTCVQDAIRASLSESLGRSSLAAAPAPPSPAAPGAGAGRREASPSPPTSASASLSASAGSASLSDRVRHALKESVVCELTAKHLAGSIVRTNRRLTNYAGSDSSAGSSAGGSGPPGPQGDAEDPATVRVSYARPLPIGGRAETAIRALVRDLDHGRLLRDEHTRMGRRLPRAPADICDAMERAVLPQVHRAMHAPIAPAPAPAATGAATGAAAAVGRRPAGASRRARRDSDLLAEYQRKKSRLAARMRALGPGNAPAPSSGSARAASGGSHRARKQL